MISFFIGIGYHIRYRTRVPDFLRYLPYTHTQILKKIDIRVWVSSLIPEIIGYSDTVSGMIPENHVWVWISDIIWASYPIPITKLGMFIANFCYKPLIFSKKKFQIKSTKKYSVCYLPIPVCQIPAHPKKL